MVTSVECLNSNTWLRPSGVGGVVAETVLATRRCVFEPSSGRKSLTPGPTARPTSFMCTPSLCRAGSSSGRPEGFKSHLDINEGLVRDRACRNSLWAVGQISVCS